MKLRVAFLEKKECVYNGCFQNSFIDSAEKWVVFGHFDAMYIYNSEEENILSAIHNNNKKILGVSENSSYYSALYMIATDNDEFFWNSKKPFLTLIRVHFSPNISFSVAQEKLKTSLKKDLQEDNFIQCIYEIYNTLELSDAIIAVKSESLSDIIKISYKIKQLDFVGEVYTYSAILEKCISEQKGGKEDDIMDLISLRFSVSHSNNVEYITNLATRIFTKTDCFLTNGLDDILLTAYQVSTKSLIQFYYELFFSGQTGKDKNSSIITRIGLSFSVLNGVQSISTVVPEKSKLEEACEILFKRTFDIQKSINSMNEHSFFLSEQSWNRTLSEIVKLLLRMSKTAVLDEFVYLIIPSMAAFLSNIEGLLNKSINENTINLQEQYVYEYLQSTAELAEQITRTERQLSHNPELRPIIYDIPIAVLEYSLAILTTCSEMLTANEDNNEKIKFLLLPRLCKHVAAKEVFPATEKTIGLVLINVPMELLYDPKKLMSNLIHEISHFIGEKHRYRKERLENYAKTSAIFFCKLILNTYNSNAISTVSNELLQIFGNKLQNKEKTRIDDMQSIVNRWAYNIIREKHVAEFSDLIRRIISDNKSGIAISFNRSAYIANYNTYFQPLLKNITMLFREVYADICMLYFLPITSEEYTSLIYEDVKDEPYGTDIYWLFVIRMYICLKVSKRDLSLIAKDNANYSQIAQDIMSIQDDLSSNKEKQDSFYPIGVTLQVLQYAEKCYNSMESHFNDNAALKHKEKQIVDFYKKFYYKDFLDTIDNFRYNILNEFDNL